MGAVFGISCLVGLMRMVSTFGKSRFLFLGKQGLEGDSFGFEEEKLAGAKAIEILKHVSLEG